MAASDESDDDLVRAIVGGSRDAFAELYRRRRPDVYRFAVHMTGSPAAAEDVTQDVFMAVIQDARRYSPGRAAVVAWLLGIARNHARRLARERLAVPLDEVAHDGDLAAQPDPVARITRRQQLALLRAALRSLPVAYREIVVLCDLQERTYAEAADAVGCAVGTVRSRLHRGRALLTAKLGAAERHLARWPAPDWLI